MLFLTESDTATVGDVLFSEQEHPLPGVSATAQGTPQTVERDPLQQPPKPDVTGGAKPAPSFFLPAAEKGNKMKLFIGYKEMIKKKKKMERKKKKKENTKENKKGKFFKKGLFLYLF